MSKLLQALQFVQSTAGGLALIFTGNPIYAVISLVAANVIHSFDSNVATPKEVKKEMFANAQLNNFVG